MIIRAAFKPFQVLSPALDESLDEVLPDIGEPADSLTWIGDKLIGADFVMTYIDKLPGASKRHYFMLMGTQAAYERISAYLGRSGIANPTSVLARAKKAGYRSVRHAGREEPLPKAVIAGQDEFTELKIDKRTAEVIGVDKNNLEVV